VQLRVKRPSERAKSLRASPKDQVWVALCGHNSLAKCFSLLLFGQWTRKMGFHGYMRPRFECMEIYLLISICKCPKEKRKTSRMCRCVIYQRFFPFFFWLRGNVRNIAYPNKNILSAMEFLTIRGKRKERSSPEKGSLLLDFPFTPLLQVELK